MDSPFCHLCLRNGLLSNTYKVIRRPEFKCGTCKKRSLIGEYEEIAFKWRTDKEAWEAGIQAAWKKGNLKPNQATKDRLDEVRRIK